ncbi:Coiled-coil domain-containing protein 68 [Frankliniella fusca]|uniref:Coiled-coil domain-containing protein 68 n=1 Tax=Frankliniella fusca TaxID=407009 RepID=A0AAE1LCL7_9NEOP|nr:Coiled-coil domain-containing protein 68 [Frankliniella fusca]
MNCKAILAVALVALVALQLASAHPLSKRSCACNLKGTDVCTSCIPAAVPRPANRGRAPVGMHRVVYQKFAPIEFQPKDICTCQGGLVTAPEIPRVPCKVHSGHPHQAPNYDYPGSNGLFGGSGDDCGDAPVNPCEEGGPAPSQVKTYVIPAENSLPAEELVEEVPVAAPSTPIAADAVSLALAYDLATKAQKNILEENLAFGHMQTPKDGRVVIKKKVVPESSLYAVRNQIVELKAPSGYGRSCEDEAEASLLAAQQASCTETEEGSYGAPLPSYRDLGFAPVGGDCKFVPGQYQPSPNVVQTVEYSVPAPAPAPAGPAYGPCDALASLERGRGSQGIDYYSSQAQAEAAADAAAAEAAAPNCAEESGPAPGYGLYGSGPSYGSGSGSSYGHAPAPRAGPAHTGRRGCSCGCGY